MGSVLTSCAPPKVHPPPVPLSLDMTGIGIAVGVGAVGLGSPVCDATHRPIVHIPPAQATSGYAQVLSSLQVPLHVSSPAQS
jgi:hypothetical protein